MKKIYLLILCFVAYQSFGQVIWEKTYYGNGRTGFGGTVGQSQLKIEFYTDSVIMTLTKGPGDLNDAVVIYVQTNVMDTGISNTFNLTDDTDPLRSAISGFSSGNRAGLTFPTGFYPTQAIAFNSEFGGSFELVENGPHKYQESGNLQPLNNTKAPVYRISLPFHQDNQTNETFTKDDTGEEFRFLVTYISTTGYRSNEFIGDAGPDVNPGWTNYVTTSFETGSAPVVPVTLTNFQAASSKGAIQLLWSTSQESNIDRYEILRSADGTNFEKIGAVNANNLATTQQYTYRDEHPLAGDNFYKLAIIGKDNQKEYSKVVSVKSNAVQDFKAYLTSSNRVLKLELPTNLNETIMVEINNSVGQKVYSGSFKGSGTTVQTIDLNKQLKSGVYGISIIRNGERQSKMVMVK